MSDFHFDFVQHPNWWNLKQIIRVMEALVRWLQKVSWLRLRREALLRLELHLRSRIFVEYAWTNCKRLLFAKSHSVEHVAHLLGRRWIGAHLEIVLVAFIILGRVILQKLDTLLSIKSLLLLLRIYIQDINIVLCVTVSILRYYIVTKHGRLIVLGGFSRCNLFTLSKCFQPKMH